MPRILDWRRALLLTHRWLGIAGGLLFLAWFASGIVMIYARMPALDPAERLARLPPLDAGSVAVSPAEAAAAAGVSGQALLGVRLGMLGDRPVYRFGGAGGTVFADDGRPLAPLSPEEATRLVAQLVPEHAASLRYEAYLTEPDQWMLQDRGALPAHRIALGDEAGTEIHLSDRTGHLVMKTTASGRRWAYAGAVLHWLYFTPFRVHSNLWAQTIIWLSIAGCLLALSGLAWGLVRFSVGRRYRVGGRPSRSPYSGLLRWHHYAGLLFGLFTFTWTLSGGLSMDPWSWHPGTGPTREQREGVSGGPLRVDAFTVDAVRAATRALAGTASPPGSPTGAGVLKEVGLMQLAGTPYFLGYGSERLGPEALLAPPRLVGAGDSPGRPFIRFGNAEILAAARAAMPGVEVTDATWLWEHDAYYYGRGGGAGPPLPVLRVRFADAARTWLYLDPTRGAIVRKEERLTRLNRWLYHGLHSLDFPWLYRSRPLWDIAMILLSLGGIAVAATTLLPGWRRLVGHVRRLTRSGR